MPLWTCFQCGAQFPDTPTPPSACRICDEERQFVNWSGQRFIDRDELAASRQVIWRDDDGVTGLGLDPSFAIG
ncbi:MAG: MBL fold metallo-hydrolase, partial [Bradyrhizobium sp.]|nr:MBL fold metallo-hydrolase [Bradyrhizobium sp.]